MFTFKKVLLIGINDITSEIVEIYEQLPVVQWKPLNGITEGHRQTDSNNRLIKINKRAMYG
jgi:hypothetical protein